MIPLIAAPAAPSFDHPLEMLRACHGKILQQCDTLKKLTAHLDNQGFDAEVQQAAAGILRYFDTAGQFHHQDEEEDLFPALRSCTTTTLLELLLSDHIVMLSAWDALRPRLVQLAEGREVVLEAALTEKFISSYTSHIAIENAELLPLAARLLSAQQVFLIGRSMASRRGAKFPEAAENKYSCNVSIMA